MGELLMTRRAFAKVMAVTAAAAGFTGLSRRWRIPSGCLVGRSQAHTLGLSRMRQDGVRRLGDRSGWAGCQTEGDESAFQSAGNHCAKGQASLQAAYHPDRLMYPLKRTNPKGQEPGWVRISWMRRIDPPSRQSIRTRKSTATRRASSWAARRVSGHGLMAR